jgi:hypothetical protein
VSVARATERSKARDGYDPKRLKISILFQNSGYEKGSFEFGSQIKGSTEWV